MKILENRNLQHFNTFGLAANGRYFCTLTDQHEIEAIGQWQQAHPDLPVLFLGGGSNILFVHDFPGLVVHVHLQSMETIGQDDDYHYVRAGAGNNWHEFVRWTIDQGFAGLENLSLIPGTVGAAPMQNIGAYGVEVKDVLHRVHAVDWRSGERREFNQEACRFGYRDSYFKSVEPDRWLIVAVEFRLPKKRLWKIDYPGIRQRLEGEKLTARAISDAIIALRQSKLPDPAQIGNAGSFFKNPMITSDTFERLSAENPGIPGWILPDGNVKTSAAWLIDRCDWKGKREGDVGTYAKHALVLVNHGHATGAEIWRFAQSIIASVEDRFGIALEPEPRVIL